MSSIEIIQSEQSWEKWKGIELEVDELEKFKNIDNSATNSESSDTNNPYNVQTQE